MSLSATLPVLAAALLNLVSVTSTDAAGMLTSLSSEDSLDSEGVGVGVGVGVFYFFLREEELGFL